MATYFHHAIIQNVKKLTNVYLLVANEQKKHAKT